MVEARTFTEREAHIFEGVLRLAASGADLAQLKVQDIADAAGMGKGTLYEYFRSKEEILIGTLFYCIQRELVTLEALADTCPDFLTLTERSLDYVADLVNTRATSYRLIARVLASSQHLARYRDMLAGYGQRLKALLCRSQQLGIEGHFIRSDCDFPYFLYTVASAYLSFANALLQQKEGLLPCFICPPPRNQVSAASLHPHALDAGSGLTLGPPLPLVPGGLWKKPPLRGPAASGPRFFSQVCCPPLA